MKICDFGGLIWVVGHGGRWMWLVGAMVVLFCLFVFVLFVCFFCFLFFFPAIVCGCSGCGWWGRWCGMGGSFVVVVVWVVGFW